MEEIIIKKKQPERKVFTLTYKQKGYLSALSAFAVIWGSFGLGKFFNVMGGSWAMVPYCLTSLALFTFCVARACINFDTYE